MIDKIQFDKWIDKNSPKLFSKIGISNIDNELKDLLFDLYRNGYEEGTESGYNLGYNDGICEQK